MARIQPPPPVVTAADEQMIRDVVRLAMDRSLRSYDANGRLHVETCRISKANICGYLGREIPNSEQLGLQPDKLYYLLRDPAELEAAKDTFRNLPLLIRHVPVSAERPAQELVVGTVGTDVSFDGTYLCSSLAVWTAEAINKVESGELEQLSSAYGYRADMTPGVLNGQRYDGVMRDIVGNHVALVREGRAGPDVVVSDSNLEFSNMKRPSLVAAIAALFGASAPNEAQLLALDTALDSELDDTAQDCDLSADEMTAAEKTARDAKAAAGSDGELTDEEKKAAYKAAAKDKKAKDAKTAMDAAIAAAQRSGPRAITQTDVDAAVSAGVTAAVAKVNALHTARAAVRPFVGEVAMDSADAVYEFALKKLNVDVAGVHPSAFPALLKTVGASITAHPSPRIAEDSTQQAARLKAVNEAFPGLSRLAVAG